MFIFLLSLLSGILKYYDLADHFLHDQNFLENEIPHDDDETKSTNFQDRKLRGMWRRAKEAGFSGERDFHH